MEKIHLTELKVKPSVEGLYEKLGVLQSAVDQQMKLIERAKHEAEETLIKGVLEQLLGRPITFDDAARIRRIILLGQTDGYILAYDGVPLGKVFYWPCHSITFFPAK